MDFWTDDRGTAMPEWVVVAALVLAILGVAIHAVCAAGDTEASSIATWLTDLGVPSVP